MNSAKDNLQGLKRMAILAMVAGMLAACGARGPLEPAPGAEAVDPDPPFVLDSAI